MFRQPTVSSPPVRAGLVVTLLVTVLLVGCDGDSAGIGGEAGDAGISGGGPTAGLPAPVEGRWWTRLYSAHQSSERPIDLSGGRVGVWTGVGTGRRWLAGSGDAQGNFRIDEVPAGPFLLEVGAPNAAKRVIASPGELRAFRPGHQSARSTGRWPSARRARHDPRAESRRSGSLARPRFHVRVP